MKKILLKHKKRQLKKALLLSIKIAIGSSIAIYIAELLNLEYATSAGTVTLLTLMTTKWETVRLSFYRLLTFAFATALSYILFITVQSEWIGFGVLMFFVTAFAEIFGWRATISVNAVVGTHLLMQKNFTAVAIWNELQIVLIGISLAFLLNLFHGNMSNRKVITHGMYDCEQRLQNILQKLAYYLNGEVDNINVWKDIFALKTAIQIFSQEAHDYQENTFQDMGYYQQYLEMRLAQCIILANLDNEIQKLQSLPIQSAIVADYMLYLSQYVLEKNRPEKQIERLNAIFIDLKNEPMPTSREEFENRAILYHVLMDMEDFLKCKEKFVNELSDEDLKKYWYSKN